MRSIDKQQLRSARPRALAMSALATMCLAACGGGGGGGADAASAQGAMSSPSGTTASAAAPVQAVGPITTGPQAQRINGTTAGNQVGSAIARLASGGHVVAWNSQAVDGTTAVCAQRYAADGQAAGAQACIPTRGATTNIKPAVAALADGGHVIAWVVRDDGGSQTGVRTQRYDANGTPAGAEQKVNLRSGDELYPVAAAGLAGGGYVIAWKSTTSDILVRRFDAAGMPQGEEQRANAFLSRTGGSRYSPAVASLADGGWVVGWSSQFQDGASGSAIYVQRFGADGAPAGSETRVSDPAQNGVNPALAPLAGGGYLLTWQSGERVLAQRFATDGAAQDAATPVDASEVAADCYQRHAPTSCRITQRTPALAVLEDGSYVITWNAGPGNYLYARRFSAQGGALGAVTQLADGQGPAVAATGAGGFMVSWHAWDLDGDMGGIYGRRFDASAAR
ncbi:hypothetical protein [Ramlibacter tataouinensis]|uniref:Uncharacterized protein n=1 Tax=Ramlibacter tataouinensis (strain ATCC BAA-407 / DSM 14655 / LMG 21543 / TTB310) TaxID=365046 RepID=F5XZA5_RAMTT|nr:hypothetical protein [Ramlibacter tataouinensis]AEG93275.1 Hypothetical protein Rta_21790 [Ramlibacter tataouinensis TTB310]